MKLEAKDIKAGYYNASGDRIPSVTTIAKLITPPEALIWWSWDCGMKGLDYRTVRDEAADAGHLCHSMVECAILSRPFVPADGIEPHTMELAMAGFSAFQSWQRATNFRLITSEVRVISERYQYGGRLDGTAIATVQDELTIVDWKTAKGRKVRESWIPQVAGYRQAWNETHQGQKVESCHLIVLGKEDAGFSHHYFPSSTVDLGWRAFLACKELYDVRKAVQKLL